MKKEFMNAAIEISNDNLLNNLGGPFGAVIIRDNKIIGSGGNRVTSTNDPTAHAEIVAIRDACQKINSFSLEGAEIYTSCEPCPMCLSAIYWARISKIYYANARKDAESIGFDDSYIYEQISLPFDLRDIPIEQISSQKAIEVFMKWKLKTDKTQY